MRQLLRVPEVAEALEVSTRTVWRLLADGRLASIRVGRSVRVRAADVETLILGGARATITEILQRSLARLGDEGHA
jgi:excisionase family DNA binding protein